MGSLDTGSIDQTARTDAAAAQSTANTAQSTANTALTAATTPISSMVRLNTANGYGSTNNKIRRFSGVVTNQGADITYADSATLGASFTINAAGMYAVSFSDTYNAAGTVGISLDTTQPTVSVVSLSAGEQLASSASAAANFAAACSVTLYLPIGAVVRPHTSGVATGALPAESNFTISRVD